MKKPGKGFKWEPAVAMIALLLLGVWVAFAPTVPQPKAPGAERVKLTAGPVKGVVEWVPGDAGTSPAARTFTVHLRDGTSTGPLTQGQLESVLGVPAVAELTANSGNWMYTTFNVSSPVGIAWVVLGFAGQLAFSGRWLLQWFISEKSRSSTVPVSFWWMSLIGSVMLFAYFVWRNDVVALMGQTSGVVIYARNIRLIGKQRRREARASAEAEGVVSPPPASSGADGAAG